MAATPACIFLEKGDRLPRGSETTSPRSTPSRVRPAPDGERLLGHGAAGGFGTALLQLGRLAGLQMYGTASRRHHELVASLIPYPPTTAPMTTTIDEPGDDHRTRHDAEDVTEPSDEDQLDQTHQARRVDRDGLQESNTSAGIAKILRTNAPDRCMRLPSTTCMIRRPPRRTVQAVPCLLERHLACPSLPSPSHLRHRRGAAGSVRLERGMPVEPRSITREHVTP